MSEPRAIVMATEMAEGYTPPSASLNPAATLDKTVADDYEAQVEDLTQRLNMAAADLLETRSQRAHLARQLDEMERSAIQHAERHQRIFEEMLRERARLVDERDELAKTLESEREHHKGVREYAVARQAERDEARGQVDAVRSALGESLDASDAGLPGDVQLVIDQRNVAWRTLERVAGERDEAVAEADRTSDALHDLTLERNRFADELVRLRTIIGELGAAEAAEPPPDHFCAADCDCKPAAERGDAP